MTNRTTPEFDLAFDKYQIDNPTESMDFDDAENTQVSTLLAMLSIYRDAKNKRDVKKVARMLLKSKSFMKEHELWKYIADESVLEENAK